MGTRLRSGRIYRIIAIGITAIVAISNFPGIAIACEGAAEEWILGEEKGGKDALAVFPPNKGTCEGENKVLDVSTVPATIEIIKETEFECTIRKKLCEGKILTKNGEFCQSQFEKVSNAKTPEYELEVKVNGKEMKKRFAA